MELSAGDVPMFGGTTFGQSSGLNVPPGLFLDPSSMLLLPPQSLDPLGRGQMQLPIPPAPALIGQGLMLQSLVLDKQKSQPALTNGLHVTIGN